MPEPSGQGPLAGIRVVDLSRARAGPTCTRQLADLGADVVHVGHPRAGDLAGSDADNLQRNKRSILLDLATGEGRAVLRRLVAAADVLVENFRPSVKHRLGLGPATLLAEKPSLVYASISGFGQTGPYADRPGVDQIVQGMGGLMSVTGPPGSGPFRTGIAISDTAAGTLAAQGVLAALFVRERTGRGQWVHTSLLEAMISFMDFQAVRYLNEGEVPGQAGNDHPTITPMGTYRSADGYLNAAGALAFDRFCEALGAPELAFDPRFSDPGQRARHRRELHEAIETRTTTAPTAVWVERLNAVGIPAGPVLRMDEVFADPQVRHLDLVVRFAAQAGRATAVLRHPVSFSSTPATVRTPPPVPGAHTVEVLAEHGYSTAEIDRLIRTGVVATTAERQPWGAPPASAPGRGAGPGTDA
jgi:crotonobetainyl-CoA:carnitine CoA-transferase CaiB-like acyl-CoA transferase